ncbi:hypothetical protein ScPMuIL_009482 [Solemya velum]
MDILPPKYSLLLHSAKQIVQVSNTRAQFLRGAQLQNLIVLEAKEDEGVSILVGSDGLITDIGYDGDISKKYDTSRVHRVIDASGKCVLPGLVDAHTHPVWAGDRVHEFAMKLAGATYMDVHKAGGGINFTVDHTRQAEEDHLYISLRQRLSRMLRAGTTLVECKSGYGLEVETEMKMLRVIERARRELPIGISATFLGAHSVPMYVTPEEATSNVLTVQLPFLKNLMDSGCLLVDNIDVFCEKGVFDVTQSRRILEAGQRAGLAVNFHGDELHALKAAEMGVEIGAAAVSHLEEISEEGVNAMANSDTVAVVLPTTAHILRLTPPPVRKMLDKGVVVALGSDFNPNAYCMSMPLVMHLACVTMRMTMSEALAGCTLNAAAALRKSKTHGSLEIGKRGDMIVINASRWEHLIYQLGCHQSIIDFVIVNGDIVYDKKIGES